MPDPLSLSGRVVSVLPPTAMIRALGPFSPRFSARVWQHLQVLLAGALHAPGRRTIRFALRAMDLQYKMLNRKRPRRSCEKLNEARVSTERRLPE